MVKCTALYRFLYAIMVLQGKGGKMAEEISISAMVKKRRELWERDKDIYSDQRLTCAIADKILDTESLREEVIKSPELLIEACFSIVDKRRETVPFFLNDVQRDFLSKLQTQGSSKPYFILKGRQQGFTSLITALMLAHAVVRRNFSGFTLADRDDNTKAIFIDKAKSMYNSLPKRLRPTEKFNSVNELYFDKLNSSWRIASASSNVGRSRTLSFIHYSEAAFFKCPIKDLQKSIGEAATSDAICVFETTANGFNEAKELWDSGACHNLFYEWYKTKEYVSNEYEYLKSGDTWLNNRLRMLKSKGLTKEQLTWYAKKYHSYIDKSSIRQEYPCTPEESFVSSGDCIFDKEGISNYLSSFNVKSRRGYFTYKIKPMPVFLPSGELASYKTTLTDIKFEESENGYISIVDEPNEGAGSTVKPYVIGADTAGTGQDYFSAKVIDNTTSRCVATLHIKNIDEDLFAHQLYCLGKHYNTALIGVETNYSRHPVRVLRSLGYENLYAHSKKADTHGELEAYGFVTSAVTRPIIISNLVSIMRENIYLETDRQTLYEMTTFIKRSDGKSAAADGSHDDLVMASAIAHFISLDYEHKPKSIDTSSAFLSQNFSPLPLQAENYMEW